MGVDEFDAHYRRVQELLSGIFIQRSQRKMHAKKKVIFRHSSRGMSHFFPVLL